MFNQDGETLRASISKCEVAIDTLNSCLLRGTERYTWYWQQAPRFCLDVRRNATLELNCEDCQNDLWLATRQLYRLSVTFSQLEIRLWVEGEESNFILIEAANYLEDWYDDFDERNSAVLVSGGEFSIRPAASDKIPLNAGAQECILRRINKVHEDCVEMNLSCPVRMAASLDAHPWLLTHIAHEYLDRDATARGDDQEDSVTVRLRINRLLFAKLSWRSGEKVRQALIDGFRSLSQPGSSRSAEFLKKFTGQSIQKRVSPVGLASAEQCAKFLETYRCPSPIGEPDLSWLEADNLEYYPSDLSTVDRAVSAFFAERGTGGAQLPWQLGKECRPLDVDGDRIIAKIQSLTFSDEESSDEEDESDDKPSSLLGMSDLLESAQGENSPAGPLLSSLGVNVKHRPHAS